MIERGYIGALRELHVRGLSSDLADPATPLGWRQVTKYSGFNMLNLGILHDLYLGDGARALALYDRYLALSPGGDATVSKWVADLRRRKPAPVALNEKEKP